MKLVFLSGITWDSCIGGRTVQLAKAAALSHEVHFVTIPGLRHRKAGIKTCHNVTIHTLLPKSDKFPGLVRTYLKKKINLQDACLIVSNPLWEPVVSHLTAKKIIYDQLDYFAVHAPKGRHLEKLRMKEENLMRKANVITTVSRRLLSYSAYPEKTVLLPNGVPESFLKQETGFPAKKVIGFHGALYEWIDYDLLEFIADTFPDCTLRLVGTVRNPDYLQALKTKSNVETLPAFAFERLPEIVRDFTIGIVPFKNDEVSLCADPLKSYEYLALGKSVVSTVHSAADGETSHVVSKDKFCAEIADLLNALPSPETCRKSAEQHTWEERCRTLLQIAES